MLDETEPTQYGPLGRLPALAAQLVIHRTGVAAIIALDTVHLTLGLRQDRAATIPPSQAPSHRWYQFRLWLFGSLDDTAATASRLALPLEITPEEQHTINQLLGAAGNFLLAETRKLADQIDTWLSVEFDDDVPHGMADKVSDLRAGIITANNAAQTLLRMVGTDRWQEALSPQFDDVAEPQAVAQRLTFSAPQETHVFVAMPYGRREPDVETTQEVGRAVRVAVDSVWRQFSQSVVVIVDCVRMSADAAADRVIAWAEDLVVQEVPLSEIVLSEVVITAVDGRQTSPIPLEYSPSRRLLDECRDAIVAGVLATSLQDRAGESRPQVVQGQNCSPPLDASHLLERTENLASALAFAADANEPHRILVVSDLLATTRLGFDAVSELLASSEELQAHFQRLRESSLSFAEIAVTVVPLVHPASPQLWKLLCGDDANLTLIRPQDDLSVTHNVGATRNAVPAVTRVRGVTGPQITVIVDFSEKRPRRVLAKASALVLTMTLALVLVGAGAGFFLAGTGPGPTVASGVLLGLGSGTVSLLLARRTKSVTALRAVTSAAARVLDHPPSAARGKGTPRRKHKEIGDAQHSLV
ncbi:hypothetical protein [Lentzea terrae]|uniref:hypothetical protein n=1 Tax=Lentzea terrae TaxID=2200761 RepID=UPI000DD342A6|nr:hypothetical protein [Lentzea terrae]